MAAVSRSSIEVLQIALKKEESSLKMYSSMVEQTKVQFVRELLEQLRDEEARHVRMIQKRLSRLAIGRG